MLNNKDKLAIFGQIGPNKATFMSQLDLMVIYLKFYGRPNLTPNIGFIEFKRPTTRNQITKVRS